MLIKTKTLFLDRVIWIVVMLLAATAAWAMMKRDVARNFGSVSYGMFPKFHLQDQTGAAFDFHNLKGHVWIARFGSDSDSIAPLVETIAREYVGKHRKLHLLTFSDSGTSSNHPYHHIVSGDPSQSAAVRRQLGNPEDSVAILIDQNGAVRGLYDLQNTGGLERLRESLKGLL